MDCTWCPDCISGMCFLSLWMAVKFSSSSDSIHPRIAPCSFTSMQIPSTILSDSVFFHFIYFCQRTVNMKGKINDTGMWFLRRMQKSVLFYGQSHQRSYPIIKQKNITIHPSRETPGKDRPLLLFMSWGLKGWIIRQWRESLEENGAEADNARR